MSSLFIKKEKEKEREKRKEKKEKRKEVSWVLGIDSGSDRWTSGSLIMVSYDTRKTRVSVFATLHFPPESFHASRG